METPLIYYGGKTNLLPEILPRIPEHVAYVEPFAGGAAVFFAKKPARVEVLNDRLDLLANFYTVIKTPDQYQKLVQLIEGSLHHEARYKEAKKTLKNPKAQPYERAFALWLIISQSTNCSLEGGWKWHRSKLDQNFARSFSRRADKWHLFDYADRLRGVQIFCRDAHELIQKMDTKDTFFFIDPPYPGANQGHYRGYTMSHFRELLEILDTLKGKWMLTSYWYPELSRYETVKIHQPLSASRVAQSGANLRRKMEVISMNYTPPFQQTSLFP